MMILFKEELDITGFFLYPPNWNVARPVLYNDEVDEYAVLRPDGDDGAGIMLR